MSRGALALVCLAALALSQGCGVVVGTVIDNGIETATYPVKEYLAFGAFKYDNSWDEPYRVIEQPRDEGEELIGLCITGGGSRSAYFLTCVLEELGSIPLEEGSERTILDELDFISSVSGGSLASAYYCLKGFEEGAPARPAFFARFKEEMRKNFELRALGRLICGYFLLDLLTYYDRGDLIASVWDSNFFDDATFEELAQAEARGAPRLIVNGTNLRNGLSFVFSTIPDRDFNRSRLFERLRAERFFRFGTTESYVPFQTMGFQSLNSDIAPYPLSKAVAASAAVPNLLGPITLRSGEPVESLALPRVGAGKLVDIVDGGIYDNYGLESLMQVITARLDEAPGTPARIIVVDGSGYFGESDNTTDSFNVGYYADRTLSIAWLRARAYVEYVFRKARGFEDDEGERPYRNLSYTLISLYDVLPSQRGVQVLGGIEEPALQRILRPDVTALDFLQKITTIQTRFKISDDDADSVEISARRSARRAFEPR